MGVKMNMDELPGTPQNEGLEMKKKDSFDKLA